MGAASVRLDERAVRRVVVDVGRAVGQEAEDFRLPETAGGLIACLAVLLVAFNADRHEAISQAEEWGRVLAELTGANFDKHHGAAH